MYKLTQGFAAILMIAAIGLASAFMVVRQIFVAGQPSNAISMPVAVTTADDFAMAQVDGPIVGAVQFAERAEYSLYQVRSASIEGGVYESEVSILMPSGDLYLNSNSSLIPTFLDKQGVSHRATIIDRAIITFVLGDGRTVPARLLYGKITDGAIVGPVVVQLFSPNIVLQGTVANGVLTQVLEQGIGETLPDSWRLVSQQASRMRNLSSWNVPASTERLKSPDPDVLGVQTADFTSLLLDEYAQATVDGDNLTWTLSRDVSGLVPLNSFANFGDSSSLIESTVNGQTTWEINPDGLIDVIASKQIKNFSIVGLDLADGSADSRVLLDGGILTVDIADAAVTGAKIKDGVIDGSKIADNAVGSSEISNGAVGNSEIASGAVDASKLAGTLTFAGDQFVDLGAIDHDSTALQGIRLPNTSSATPSSPSSGEGFLAYNSSGNQVIYYDGSAWAPVGSGDITGVAVGNGLSGGGTSGDVTINLDIATTGETSSTSSNSGLETDSSGLSLLKGCATGELLKWNDTSDLWTCSTDVGAGGSGISTVEENNTSVVSSAVGLDFLGADFIVTDAGLGEADVAIDYANSKITRSDQTETIVGTWTFSAGLTATDLTCTNCIGATEISDLALGTDTSGVYVSTITSGNGISGTAAGEGSTPTLNLAALTSDWSQSGAFDIVLANASSELRILESAGATFYGTLDVGDLAADSTYTFSGTSGTVFTSANYTSSLDSVYVNVGESPAAGDISGSFTSGLNVGADAVALGADTTGNYVASVGTAVLTGLNGGSAGSEGAGLTLAFDYSQALSGNVGLGANATVFGASGLVTEGATADTVELFLAFADPTSTDKTITFPDATGTLILSGHTFSSDVTGTLGTAGTTALTIAANTIDDNELVDALTYTGALTLTPASTSDFVFTGDQDSNAQFTNTLTSDGTSVNSFDFSTTINAIAGAATVYGVNINQADGNNTGVVDALLRVQNANTNDTTPNGVLIEQTGAGTLTAALQIAETAGTITDGILITGTLANILNSGSIDITGAGAITGATGVSSTTGTFSSALAANGGITFDASTDTIGAFTAGGTILMNANILQDIGNTGTDFIAATGALTLAGDLTLSNNTLVCTACIDVTDLGANSVDDSELVDALTYTGALTLTPASTSDFVFTGDQDSNAQFTNTLTSDGTSVNSFDFSTTINAIAGAATVYGVNINQADGNNTGVVDALLRVQNANTNDTTPNGVLIEQTGAGTLTAALQIAETAGTITDGILITGTLANILNSGSIDITGAGAITGATGVSSTTGTFSSALAANGGITFDASTDTIGAFTAGGTILMANNVIENIGDTGTDFVAGGGLTLAGTFTTNGTVDLSSDSGADTITIGQSGTTDDTVTIAGNVSLTDDQWSISATGVGAFVTGTTIGSQTFTTNNIADSGALTIKSATGANALTLDSGTTGTVNLGTSNNAKTIAIGTGTAGNTVTVGTDNTTSDTITIGSALDNVAITGDQWSITDAGALTVASCTGCGGGGGTLQQAYDAGNAITTDASGDVTLTLAELATATRFEVFNQDTAGAQAVEIDNTIASGTLTDGLLIEQSGVGTMTNALQIAETAGTITDGILITGTLANILNSGSIDITGAGAITGATGVSSTTGTFSSALAANGGITFDASTDTIGAFTAGGTILMNANILQDIGNTGTDFIAATGALTLAGDLTLSNNTLVCTACIDVTDLGANSVDDSELVDALTYTGALTLTPASTSDFVFTGDQDSNAQFTNTLTSDGTSVNSFDFSTTINAIAGAATVYGVNINQADGNNTGVVDALLRVQNANTNDTTPNGVLIEQTGAGTLTAALQIAETAGTITDGILITGTLANILNSGSIDITGAGAITGATGVSSTTGTFSSALAANGGITFDASTDTIGAFTAGGTILMNANILQDIGNTGTDFIAATGALTLAGDLTLSNNTLVCTACIDVTDLGANSVDDSELVDALTYTGALTLTPASTSDFVFTGDQDSNAQFTNTLTSDGTSVNSFDFSTTINAIAGAATVYGVNINQADGNNTGVVDALLRVQNANTNDTTPNGVLIEQTGAGTLTAALQIAETAGTITDGILITGTLANILNSGSIDITGAGAITGATGVSSTTGTFSSALAANGGITFDASTDTIGAFTAGGTILMANNVIENIGDTGTDFVAGGGLTLAGTFTTNGTVDLSSDSGADTITIGQSGTTDDTVTIAGNVSLTDDQWSISATGVGAFVTGTTIGSQTFTTNNIADSGALTIKSATGANALTLDSGTTGTVNLGTSNNAKTIAIGTGTAGNTVTVGTDNTTSDTITIGSALDNVAITGDQWSITDAGALTVASCTGCGGGGGTLQQAYDAGNAITTDASGDVTLTLAELATATRFEVFNQDTAGAQAVEIDNTIASGTLTDGLLIEQSGVGTMTNALQIAETAGTITDGILITGTLANILNSGSIDITGAGAITGATGVSSTTGTFSSALAANGGITFDASTDTIGAFTAGGTILMNANILQDIGNTGTDFIAATGALTLAGDLTLSNNTLVCTACIDVTDLGANSVDDSELVDALTYTGALTLTPASTSDFVFTGDQDSNAQFTNTLTSDGTSVNSFDFSTTINAIAGAATVYGVNINQADGNNTGVVDALLRVQNANTNDTTPNGVLIEQTGAGTLTAALQIAETAGTITDGILITGTLANILNSGSIDITGAGAITGATGVSSTTGTFSSALAANGGITFDASTDTIGAFTAGGTILMANNVIENIGAAGTDFLAGGGLTLDDILTVNDDLTINVAVGENFELLDSAAPTVDVFSIVSDSATVTNGVDGLQIDFTAGDGTNFTNSGLRVNMIASGTGAADVSQAMYITMDAADTTAQRGLVIGANFDEDIMFEDSTAVIDMPAAGSLTVGDTGADLLTLDLTTNTLRLGDGSNGITFDVDGNTTVYTGSARPTKTATLIPEYIGAVLTGDTTSNLGTMTTDFCSDLRAVNTAITPTNASPCDSDLTEEHNYYTWTSTSASQDYDVWVRWQVPNDFAGWDTLTDAVQAYGWRTDATNAVTITMYDTAGTIVGSATNVATGTGQWTLTTIVSTPTGTYTQGSYVTFRIQLANDTANDHVKVGEFEIDYKARQ